MHNRVVWVCAPCHRHIHATFSEKELALTYNSVNALKAHPRIRRFIDWIEDKPPAFKPKSRSWKR
jgi:hypothetical protein